MTDVANKTSKLSILSVTLGILNFVVVGTLIVQSLYVPYDWIDLPERELEFAANRLLAGNLSLVAFPFAAFIGLLLGIAGLIRGSGGRKTSIFGAAVGVLGLAGWIVGVAWWQIVHNLDRLYVK